MRDAYGLTCHRLPFLVTRTHAEVLLLWRKSFKRGIATTKLKYGSALELEYSTWQEGMAAANNSIRAKQALPAATPTSIRAFTSEVSASDGGNWGPDRSFVRC